MNIIARGGGVLLANDSREGQLAGTVSVIRPPQAEGIPSPTRIPVPDGFAFTAAPFLTVHRHDDDVLLVIGLCHVLVGPSAPPEMTVIVRGIWSGERMAGNPAGAITALRSVEDHPRLEHAIATALRSTGSYDPGGHEAQAILLAKGVAEHGRNSVEDLRQLRYAAERHLADSIADPAHDSVSLPALIEIGIAAGRSRDIAQRVARAGLWVYRFNDPVYHAHRRHMDPTLAPRDEGDIPLPSWFRILDAGVRQCQMMASYLADELEQLHRLIQATASISAARDARAQEHFNFVATIGAVVLGLPALVLAVYGARPPDHWPWLWVAPVALCGGLAWLVAGLLPGDERTKDRNRFQSLLAATVTLVLVCFAAGIPKMW